VADVMPPLNANELSALLPAYAPSSDQAVGQRLLASLGKTPGFAGVPADVIEKALKKMPESIRTEARELRPNSSTSTTEQRARLDELATRLARGDIRRGQAIFNNPRTACVTCHAMGYLGGTLGPDLTRIGQIRTERDLLEAIVYPSASFVRSYEPVRVKTADSELLGIVRGENEEGITLAVGPGVETRVARKDVVAMDSATMSLMPQGFDGILSPDELADLVTFLKSLR
jgi:putative heme-binding domain-containing protein